MRTTRTRTRSRCFAFEREDNGKIVWVDFPTMFEQEGGFITLPDGTAARRCVGLEEHDGQRTTPVRGNVMRKPAPSDSLGFPEQCFKDREAERQRHGFTDIEFRRDPMVPEFYQVHSDSQAAKDRYTKHRGLVNRTGSLGGGVMLSREDLARAVEMVSR